MPAVTIFGRGANRESIDGLLDGKGSAAGGNSDLSPLRVGKVSE